MAKNIVQIKSWPLLFSLFSKKELHNVNFRVVGRTYYPGDIIVPYTDRKLSDFHPDELTHRGHNLTMMNGNVCIQRTTEDGRIERTVVDLSSPVVTFQWEHE